LRCPWPVGSRQSIAIARLLEVFCLQLDMKDSIQEGTKGREAPLVAHAPVGNTLPSRRRAMLGATPECRGRAIAEHS
jgi:hypothetical protein